MTDPTPDIYENVPASEYHAWPYCSASRLGQMLRSPAHCRHAMENPETTEAMAFGEAIHISVLQPELYADRFTTRGRCFAMQRDGNLCLNPGTKLVGGKWLCGIHSKGKESEDARRILSDSEYTAACGIGFRIVENAASRLLIETPGRVELSFVWDDPASGTRCKGRADKIATIAGRRVCIDLKTTTDASYNAFGRSIVNYGYHRQAAHYLNGLAILGEPAEAFIIVAVEKEAPYGVQVFDLDQEAIELGNREIGPLIAKFGECQRSGIWPAYSDRIETINLPAWKLKELTHSYQEQI